MNRIPATLTRVEYGAGMTLVEADASAAPYGMTLVATVVGEVPLTAGMLVVLACKETEVALAKNLSGEISLRNRHAARVVGIDAGTVLTRVSLDWHGHPIASVITSGSAQRLGIRIGDSVEWLVKANEMAVETA
ncbi:TOBE domain-containing protein [Jeongeupia naejangsanensis]|uniref:TOBE domain-containing protein n=1 Tax=Jeongeupia naejangsanensis TaxID=613195 RepID=A0ABS2BH55_9NEIS|nr:TOBE domain-containing protein [Jeongeupia naejangsanensis]MBM3114939.1 TOBE domain-containing protein [Jeongeupia naejangsanensis]